MAYLTNGEAGRKDNRLLCTYCYIHTLPKGNVSLSMPTFTAASSKQKPKRVEKIHLCVILHNVHPYHVEAPVEFSGWKFFLATSTPKLQSIYAYTSIRHNVLIASAHAGHTSSQSCVVFSSDHFFQTQSSAASTPTMCTIHTYMYQWNLGFFPLANIRKENMPAHKHYTFETFTKYIN